jgi:exopolyphosphatase/guanosine-5'-triphosphate,3'-diphosphate pyrophosphatase
VFLSDLSHSRQVRRLAEALFDAFSGLHRLSSPQKRLLEAAAILHDIGWCEGQQRHHKRAYDLIMAEPLDGFSRREQAVVANVARYHRKALPSLSHEGFAALDPADQELTKALAAILRIADGLDVMHNGLVRVDGCEVSGNHVVIRLSCPVDCSHELAAAIEKSDLLSEFFGLSPRLEATIKGDSVSK